MDILKKSFLKLSEQIPLNILKAVSPIDIFLPYHHLVSDKYAPHIHHLYQFKNTKQFEKDLDFLLRNFSPIGVDDVVAYVKENKQIAPNQFLLTFDDGFRECASVIAPVLLKKGVPAIFFLNNDFIGNTRLFYRLKISLLIDQLLHCNQLIPLYQKALHSTNSDIPTLIDELKKTDQAKEEILNSIAEKSDINFELFLKETQPFLNEEDIEGLVRQGFHIGGHSLSHPYFQLLPDDEQVSQAVKSTLQLAERFDQKYLLFSFPHTDKPISHAVVQRILDNGIDVLFGIQNQLPELHNRMLHRFNAERPAIPIRRQIKAEMLYAAVSKLFGRYQIHRD